MHPANLALRLALELAALAGLALAGWQLSTGSRAWLLAVGLPVVAVVIWGVFAVPGDPSRSGCAPIPVPGVVRLVLELVILGGGAAGLYVTGNGLAALLMAIALAVHYALSGHRIAWLLRC